MCNEVRKPCDFLSGVILLIGFGNALALLIGAMMGMPGIFAAGYLLVAIVFLTWGFSRFNKSLDKKRLVAWSMVFGIFLSPVFVFTPFALIFGVQYFQFIVKGPNIVQSVDSPDGQYEAYAYDAPAIDGPDQSIYVQRNDIIHYMYIAKLAGDVDSIREIKWSPDSDLVVFHTWFNLIAVRIPDYQIVKIPLGGEWTRTRPNKRSTFSSGGPKRIVAAIDFPESGVFRYRLEESEEFKSIDMNSL